MDDLDFDIQRKRASRKWRAFLIAFWTSTILLLLQIVISDTVLISGTQWVSFNTLTYGAYVTGNVMEKRNAGGN